MNVVKYIFVILVFFLSVSCDNDTRYTEWSAEIDKLNSEAFDVRYKDIGLSKAKAFEVLRLIDQHMPEALAAKAEAWNTLAYAYFLTSYFDSSRTYLNEIRAINSVYANKEIEEAISYITEARLLLRECKYAEAFLIYDSTLTLFNGGVLNRLRYNDYIPFKKYDHRRYNWAKSDYLIGNAVLGYYYRDTELPVILKSLNKIADNDRLHIDTTQLSVLYYTYAGSYEKAIRTDSMHLYHAIGYVKKGLDIMMNPALRNDYYLANFYQITGSILLNRAAQQYLQGQYVEDFKKEYLIGKYAWDAAKVASDSLPLLLLKAADTIFRQYDDPYQNLASNVHIGNYYLAGNDTVSAKAYYLKAVTCDSVTSARKSASPIWTRRLYHTLLKNASDRNTMAEIRNWFGLYSKASAVITENTRRDYNAQRDKTEAEDSAKRALFLVFLTLPVCAVVLVLLYFLNRKNNKLKAALRDNALQYQQLQFVQKKLIEQKRMELLTYVVRGISHELSQPLGSITQTLYDTFKDIETLKGGKGNLPDDVYERIVENLKSDVLTIARSKDAISDLVNSFRNTIRENIIDPETDFNLGLKLEDIVRVIKPTVKSNIRLIVDCDPGMVIRTFPLLFSQVLTNLISNANQHAFPDSDSPDDTIRIRCEQSGRDLVIQCVDNGVGIPENELDRLCQPFVSKKQTNLGLGLSLVKNIVEQYMKGEINFSSGHGLTVTVVIPGCIIKP